MTQQLDVKIISTPFFHLFFPSIPSQKGISNNKVLSETIKLEKEMQRDQEKHNRVSVQIQNVDRDTHMIQYKNLNNKI